METASVDRLRRLEVVTDARLAQLDVDELLDELLERIRELLEVDTAAVLLLNPSAQHLVATAARGLEEEVRQGVRIPLGKGFAGRIAAEKRAVVLERVDHTNVLNPILREKGIHSLLGVPLLVSGAVLGVLHVGTLHPRVFTADDTALLQLVADRIALAVHARTTQVERTAASALQRSLLPTALPEIPGLEFAARYVPGDQGKVGGDWYDVFTLPSGEVCVVLGDVVGRGLRAAVEMARLRHALRAYTLETADPADILDRLDRQVRHFEPDVMATVLCAVVDPAGEQMRVSTAGHPPPVISAGADLPAAVLELPTDLPIGVAAGRRHASTIALPPGTAVCLYTDGLVERRGQSLTVGLDRLAKAMFAGPAESVCAGIMQALVGADPPSDDIALLVLRRRPRADGDALELELPAVPGALKSLRIAVRRWLESVGADRQATADVLTAVGEACANSIEHAYGPLGGSVTVRLSFRPPDVIAEVGDTGRWRTTGGGQRGRGLTLMSALADEVTIDRTDAGTVVRIRRTTTEGGPR